MDWAGMAVVSTSLMGVASVVDSHLLSKRLPSLRAFLLPVSIIHLTYSTIWFYMYPLPEGIGIMPILAMIGSGIFRTAAVLIMLHILKKEEVSRVIPIIYTSPIFVAVMAAPLLGERLHYVQWLAIVILVAGAMLITMEKHPAHSARGAGKMFLLLFVSSLLWALADIARKYGLDFMSAWNGFCISTFVMAGSFLLISLRPETIRQFRNLAQKKHVFGFILLDETVSIIGLVLQFRAMERGPVSLVATIVGSRPVFVALYSIILSFVFPGFLIRFPNKKIMVLRLVAIGMIFVGISIIYTT